MKKLLLIFFPLFLLEAKIDFETVEDENLTIKKAENYLIKYHESLALCLDYEFPSSELMMKCIKLSSHLPKVILKPYIETEINASKKSSEKVRLKRENIDILNFYDSFVLKDINISKKSEIDEKIKIFYELPIYPQ